MTERTGFVRTNYSSWTRQEMVPSSSADLMSLLRDPTLGWAQGEVNPEEFQARAVQVQPGGALGHPPLLQSLSTDSSRLSRTAFLGHFCLIYCSCQFSSTQYSSYTSYCSGILGQGPRGQKKEYNARHPQIRSFGEQA